MKWYDRLVVATLILELILGGLIAMAVTDVPHYVRSDQLTTLADTIEQAIKIVAVANRLELEKKERMNFSYHGFQEADYYSPGFLDMLREAVKPGEVSIGNCARAWAPRSIALGDMTQVPSGSNGMVNIAGKFCFLRDPGRIVPCPPPVIACTP